MGLGGPAPERGFQQRMSWGGRCPQGGWGGRGPGNGPVGLKAPHLPAAAHLSANSRPSLGDHRTCPLSPVAHHGPTVHSRACVRAFVRNPLLRAAVWGQGRSPLRALSFPFSTKSPATVSWLLLLKQLCLPTAHVTLWLMEMGSHSIHIITCVFLASP